MAALQTLAGYLKYDFVQYALIAGVLVSLCAALLGVSLVLKRYSMIGDGLSHVAFGAMAVAGALGFTPIYVALPVTVAAAVLLLRVGQSAKIKGDAAVAMIAVGSLALGYMVMNVFSSGANVSGDVCTTLFGSASILTLTKGDVALCLILAAVVIAAYTLLYNRIFTVTFDEAFASACGVNAKGYNLFLAVITAVVIVLAMNVVGALLVSALIIFPSLSAMRLFSSFRAVTLASAVIALLSSLAGIFISVMCDTPVGATIVCVQTAVFVIFAVFGAVRSR